MVVNYFANLGYFVPELIVIGTMLAILFLRLPIKMRNKDEALFLASLL